MTERLSFLPQADLDYQRLRARKNAVSLTLTAITLVVYFGFLLLIAFGRDILSVKVVGNVTLGIPLGLGVIAVSWLLTGVYVLWANSSHDARIDLLRNQLKPQAGE